MARLPSPSEAAAPEDELHVLVEKVCFLLRQSAIIQEARLDAFLDGIELAAEQVQEVRIGLLESPQEVTGWNILGSVLVEFVMESSIPGKLVKAASTAIFASAMRRTSVFAALPKSLDGRALEFQAQSLAKKWAPLNRFRLTEGSPSEALRKAEAIMLDDAVQDGIQRAAREQRELYHGVVEALGRGTVADDDYAAAAKAVKGAMSQGTTPAPSVPTDMVGVSVRAAARDYTARTRLAMRIVHARMESEIRARRFTPAGLGPIVRAFGIEDLKLDEGQFGVEADLRRIRTAYWTLFEAVIWARLYGFDPKRGTPFLQGTSGQYHGIKKEMSEYWFTRFGQAVDEWRIQRGGSGVKFDQDEPGNKALYLHQYFRSIVETLPALAPGVLRGKLH